MKRILIPTILALLAISLASCAADTTPMQTAQPTTQVTANPSPTTMMEDTLPDDTLMNTETPADMTGAPEAQGVTSVTNARKAIEQIEDELERLSEVTDAQVIVAGNTAAVALQFDKQYQGGIDDRLEKMVKERIKGVVSGVDNVHVTQDTNLFDQLDKLGDRLDGASDMADIQTELDAIVNKIRQAA